jgi:archaellum component FlaG (FlaF/FlaG flagellin family)
MWQKEMKTLSLLFKNLGIKITTFINNSNSVLCMGSVWDIQKQQTVKANFDAL